MVKIVRVRRGVPDGLMAGHRGLGLRPHVGRRHDRFHIHRPREPLVLQAPSTMWNAAEIRDVSFTFTFTFPFTSPSSRSVYFCLGAAVPT